MLKFIKKAKKILPIIFSLRLHYLKKHLDQDNLELALEYRAFVYEKGKRKQFFNNLFKHVRTIIAWLLFFVIFGSLIFSITLLALSGFDECDVFHLSRLNTGYLTASATLMIGFVASIMQLSNLKHIRLNSKKDIEKNAISESYIFQNQINCFQSLINAIENANICLKDLNKKNMTFDEYMNLVRENYILFENISYDNGYDVNTLQNDIWAFLDFINSKLIIDNSGTVSKEMFESLTNINYYCSLFRVFYEKYKDNYHDNNKVILNLYDKYMGIENYILSNN